MLTFQEIYLEKEKEGSFASQRHGFGQW